MTGTALALHATVAASVLVGVPVTWRAVRSPATAEPGGRPVGPGWWLAGVVVLLFVNQVLFTVYALRVHGGDMSYLGGYVPDGWFQLADLTWLADRWPAPELLALSVFRVPSLLLELPLGIFAYLTVLNWLDPRLYRRLATTPVLAAVSASYTITFGLIEWAMHTTYTNQDLALRAVCGVLTVLVARRVCCQRSAPPGAGAPRDAAELLAFAASTAALGYLILSLYDSVLLYSMGKIGQHLLGATIAGIVLVASRIAANRLRAREASAGPGIDTLTSGLSWWLALFLVPALAIRYELGFGSRLFAAAAGLLVIGAATAAALSQVYGRLPLAGRALATRRWLLGLALAAVTGALAAVAGFAVPADHQETRLLWAGALFVLTATLVTTAWDRRQA
ncbi:hypothetical protein Acy02nite_74510 [Actinoplanes cyaneus]|uniref:Uncharacterized protein n=1 Tax=Actinoplanes cyaneus TaxID=52696 RepID=A0A919INZ2_9ACTN|nr:hypothetical protein [Actinoplanes cyaneus]MCW2142995.1 hypothetical protein [Actinoplanes cyaneus]GID69570.1 hypothetical protein Acy02nite_74510 [Actinoplanes cyaneus]